MAADKDAMDHIWGWDHLHVLLEWQLSLLLDEAEETFQTEEGGRGGRLQVIEVAAELMGIGGQVRRPGGIIVHHHQSKLMAFVTLVFCSHDSTSRSSSGRC